MKALTILTTAMLLLVLSTSGALADFTSSNIHLENSKWDEATAEDHLTTAQSLEQKIAALEDKVVTMAEKVTQYDQKPYLDPKSLRRDSLKRIIGSTFKEIKELRERVAWHRTEASRLADGKESRPDSQPAHGQIRNSEKDQIPSS